MTGWRPDPVERGLRAVGARTGLVSELSFRPAPKDGEDTVLASAEPASLAETLPMSLRRDPPMGLGGKGETTGEAATTLVGEFFERYCVFHPIGSAFDRTTATLSELDDTMPAGYVDVVGNERRTAAGFRSFDPDTPVDWIRGVTPDGQRPYVPVERVSLAPQNARIFGDHTPRFYASSNGCACGSQPAGAVLRATYERVERDAIMQTWYSQRTPDRIDTSAYPAVEETKRQVSSGAIEQTLVDLGGVDGLHVVGVVVSRSDGDAPAFAISAGASLDFVTAACDALSESIQIYRTMREIALTKGLASDVSLSDQKNLWACPQYYARPENADRVAFLTNGPTVAPEAATDPPERSVTEELSLVFDRLEAAGVDPIVFDLTTPDVRELGMHVVRTLAPGLVDMPIPALAPAEHPAFPDGLATTDGHPVA